jgi:long-chain acyl-CoA synthetase
MNVAYIRGTRSLLLPRWDTVKVFEAIQEFRVQRMSVVPTMLSLMLHHPDRERYDLSSLERVATGGSALPEPVRLEFARVFKCAVKQGYGLSEATTTLAGYSDKWTYRPGSVGRAIPGVEIAILDDENRPLGPKEAGEICARGPNMMKGYLNKPDATKAVFAGGWLHTGDVGYLDEEGFVFITDRKKELIIKGGENISPREIEEVLYKHDAIAEAAVVGIPDPTYGENLCAVVVTKPGCSVSEEDLKAHVGQFLTKFKIPVRVVFTDALPKNPTGKIQKRAIVAQLTSG